MSSIRVSSMLMFLAIVSFSSGCAGIVPQTEIALEQPEKQEDIIGQATLTAKSSVNRIANMALACSAINNHKVNPRETFSFNQVVGKRTTERGYKSAPVIVSGKHVNGIGGGICQVSSALYNAIRENPFIAIVERHKHSAPVSYTQNDATVSYGTKDFKFRNDYDVPIIIQAISDGGTVQIKIYK